MGGHGGLNILPQKKWNVYNYENREKVRQDEEAAALEEKLKQEQSRRRDAEFRLDRLRQACGLHNSSSASSSSLASTPADSRHINLFDGLKGFSSLAGAEEGGLSGMKQAKVEAEDVGSRSGKKRKREDVPVKVQEDEKYKLGYGLIGKGVDAPWYTSRPSILSSDDVSEGANGRKYLEGRSGGSVKKGGERKKVEELREERLRREKKEKERERLLLASLGRMQDDRGFSR
ncbi:hypothetical protein KSP40_PGU013058 [Platanthera guangdongensis]|uniref:CBF1-interacting co-repressor CIR N-terminal domain-containing protein n=1 Tax=Platanthera guangdongensis TaxID=2320717 RepID=A0ABR2LNW5_9ASPA